ncbi:MAG: hypothetical protein ACI9H8_001819, partial [Lysobacterales bacterium]
MARLLVGAMLRLLVGAMARLLVGAMVRLRSKGHRELFRFAQLHI